MDPAMRRDSGGETSGRRRWSIGGPIVFSPMSRPG